MNFKQLLLSGFLLFASLTYGQDLNLSFAIIPQELRESSNLIVRDERIHIDIPDRKTLIYRSYKAVTVLNKTGFERLGAYVFYSKNSSIRTLKAKIYNQIGLEVQNFKKKDFKDISAVSGGTLFSDSRMKYLNYTPASYPFTVVLETETITDNTAFIPAWYPQNGYYQGLEKSSLLITYDASLGFKYLMFDENDFFEKEESVGRLRLSAKNLMGIAPETYSQGFRNIASHAIFGLDKFHLEGVDGLAENWKEFGSWMQTHLLAGTGEVPDNTKREILNLVKGLDNPVAKARKIYEYVQNKTRYISVQVGIGGWKPMLAADVDALGYGDCKALTNYTKSLLEIAGIPSYYTILYAGSEKRDIKKDFTSMQGNHAILAIPEEDDFIWLECTSQDIPFGFLGDFTQDRDVMVVTPEGGEIVHTAIYDYKNNTQELNGSLTIEDDGGIKANVNMRSRGIQFDDRYFLESESEETQKRHYYDLWSYVNNIKIDQISIDNNKEAVAFNEKIDFTADGYASFAGNEMLVCLNALNRWTRVPQRYKNRSSDVQIQRGFVDVDTVKIKLPSSYKLESTPESTVYEGDFGSYTVELIKEGDSDLLYMRRFELYEGDFPKEKYTDFRKFLKKVVRLDNQKIVLTKK